VQVAGNNGYWSSLKRRARASGPSLAGPEAQAPLRDETVPVRNNARSGVAWPRSHAAHARRAGLAAMLLAGALAGCQAPAHRILAANLQAHVDYLAAPEMRGRAYASPEEERAAEYIARELRQAGLKPPPGWD